MFKGLSQYNISTSYSSRGWFDTEFNPARYEEYGRSAITTATAPLHPSERTKVLADYLAESIVEAAKATEKQQIILSERNKKKRRANTKKLVKSHGNLANDKNVKILKKVFKASVQKQIEKVKAVEQKVKKDRD